jgi:Flp pilus assembly protein TadB
MRTIIMITTVGLGIALAGAAVAHDRSSAARHLDEKAEHAQSHDERAENSATRSERREANEDRAAYETRERTRGERNRLEDHADRRS